ncbi:DEAD/DEAH box helicase [Acinetobacter beijerinckii]|uniref:DEAD/DEAH box helicase n=1 Tax=Acinetobacter beijerinckii TaxID=262668 RepID=UPI003016A1DA
MKPEFNSKRLFGITRSKGKMYELEIPENLHISIPDNSNPEELLILTIGILGDAAAYFYENDTIKLPDNLINNLLFSASFFDAFIESRLNTNINRELMLIASSTYYLAGRPGSSLVIARKISQYSLVTNESSLQRFLRWLLLANWKNFQNFGDEYYCFRINSIAKLLEFHYYNGENILELTSELKYFRDEIYKKGSPIELLYSEITIAIIKLRLKFSAWNTLPRYSEIGKDQWANVINKPDFPKELWPSQIKIGEQGLFRGKSGVIQMPTSAGKTKSVEIILRSAFLSNKTKLAVVIAPFRALCHEIAQTLKTAFNGDSVRINELSDVLQLDFMIELAELFGNPHSFISSSILVVTPEKFLYLLRHKSTLINHIGTIIYDEGHQFDTGRRGITYELLLTEIKKLLSSDAQTILISAVINNAKDIATWLIGENSLVVDGQHLLSTSRAITFASWIENLGQLIFYEDQDYSQYDYFLPRVLNQQKLKLIGKERKERIFPSRNDASEIALYLGCRFVPNGAVAIFNGRKDSAYSLIKKIVDIYNRDFLLKPPAAYSNSEEIRKLFNLISKNFGINSVLSKAALLGAFLHHGTTPNGLRLAIEFAMQKSLINFVSCTSTLAQGVNLPLRYLIIPSIYQAGTKIKVRDFQNLIGRAGRSGMHTEGLIIFSDPQLYDKKIKESYKFKEAINLLDPNNTENITSSLLAIFSNISVPISRYESISLGFPTNLLISGTEACQIWAEQLSEVYPQKDIEFFLDQIEWRKKLSTAIESYLMANRGDDDFSTYLETVVTLAKSTLAYDLADEDQKNRIVIFFEELAKYLEEKEPLKESQHIFSKTLLGIESSKEIFNWVENNREYLLNIQNNDEWLSFIWKLLAEQVDDQFFHSITPIDFSLNLAKKWISGCSYEELINFAIKQNAKKPFGKKNRKLSDDDIMNFCENTLGFHGSLIIAAIGLFLFDDNFSPENEAAFSLIFFQKSLKYGLPHSLYISCFEYGFSDRFLAQELCDALLFEGFAEDEFYKAVYTHLNKINEILASYPSYFLTILKT